MTATRRLQPCRGWSHRALAFLFDVRSRRASDARAPPLLEVLKMQSSCVVWHCCKLSFVQVVVLRRCRFFVQVVVLCRWFKFKFSCFVCFVCVGSSSSSCFVCFVSLVQAVFVSLSNVFFRRSSWPCVLWP
jgi:hypothetical protein